MDMTQLIEATRSEFKALDPKRKAELIKNVALRMPNDLARKLMSGVPPSFQIGRIDRWLSEGLAKRIEESLLDAASEKFFEHVVVLYFTEIRKAMNDRLLELIEPNGSASLDEAVAVLGKEFASDPYLKLYSAAVKWVRADEEELEKEERKEQEKQKTEETVKAKEPAKAPVKEPVKAPVKESAKASAPEPVKPPAKEPAAKPAKKPAKESAPKSASKSSPKKKSDLRG